MKTHLGPQLYFGTFYMIAFLGVLYFVFVSDFSMTDTQEKIAMIMVGILSGGLGQIMNFLFGSSAGSKAKSDALILSQASHAVQENPHR